MAHSVPAPFGLLNGSPTFLSARFLVSLLLTACGGESTLDGSAIGGDDQTQQLESVSFSLAISADGSGAGASAEDVPGIVYDMSSDATSALQLGLATAGRVGRRLPPSFGASPGMPGALLLPGLLTDSASTVSGQFSGSVDFSGSLDDTSQLATLSFTNYQSRQGLPALESGELSLDLDLTATTITGTMSSEALTIGDYVMRLNADYDLYLENSMWKGTSTGTIEIEGQVYSYTYDYDTPIISSVTVVPLDEDGNETTGALQAGNSARVRLTVNSNSPPNWINTSWNSPTTNLIGGGNGSIYCRLESTCTPGSAGTFYEVSRGYWTWFYDYNVSEYQPNGTYSWVFSVENAAMLESRDVTTSIEVTGGTTSSSGPVITYAGVATSGTDSGEGGTVTLKVVAQSEVPVNWVTLVLNSPSGNLEGGGSGVTFTACTEHATDEAHPCFGLGDDHWYYSRVWTFTEWSESGTYTFASLSVTDASNHQSASAAPFGFTISGTQTAVTPTFESITMVRYASDPLTDGVAVNGACITPAMAGDPLRVALIIISSSNAPIDWLNYTFDGPTQNLLGGGGGVTSTDLGSNRWRFVFTTSIDSPADAPKGTYRFPSISVANAGDKTSANYSGTLSFQLKNSCP